MSVYPVDRLYEEVAFVAYHFNWGHDEVLAMPHHERQRWCEEISAINDRMNRDTPGLGKSRDSESGGMTLTQEVDFGESE